MSCWQPNTPVALLIFNRPDVTAMVFAAIAKAKPPALFVIGDGPRAERPGEDRLCQAARDVIARVDWQCEVRTNYSSTNLGCRQRVSSGLNWVFENVEEAIVLEDDCMPDSTFFRFCEELLARYREDERVMHVGGANFQRSMREGNNSYYFSRHTHVWGWASWRRAWRHYDASLSAWPRYQEWARRSQSGEQRREHWQQDRLCQRVFDSTLDTWDAQWAFACRTQHGLSVIPARNLVTNLGFGASATHTSDAAHPASSIPLVPLEFPLRHPEFMVPNDVADAETDRMFRQSFPRRARSLLFRTWYRMGRLAGQACI